MKKIRISRKQKRKLINFLSLTSRLFLGVATELYLMVHVLFSKARIGIALPGFCFLSLILWVSLLEKEIRKEIRREQRNQKKGNENGSFRVYTLK